MTQLYLAIVESGKIESRSHHDYYHICLHPRFIGPNKNCETQCELGAVRMPDSYTDEQAPFCGFIVYSQGSCADDKRHLYASECRYADCHSVDLRDCERMVKLLRKIEKGMDKIKEQCGYPADFADFCGRVARILKAQGFVRHRERSASGYAYQVMSLASGIDQIRYLDRQFCEHQETINKAS